jgi:hypothetical protein
MESLIIEDAKPVKIVIAFFCLAAVAAGWLATHLGTSKGIIEETGRSGFQPVKSEQTEKTVPTEHH